MKNINTSELSLRRAVILSTQPSSTEKNIAQAIKSSALEQADLISQAQGLVSEIVQDPNLQKEAIGLAVQGIELAYHVLSTHLLETSFQRKQFVDECDNHIVSFTLNKDKEKPDFYKEEVAIQTYWELIQNECRDFVSYFGIQSNPNVDNPKITRLSIMPFFRMSQALPQKSLIASIVDQHQHAIFLFLKTGLPNKEYYQLYKETPRFFLQVEGVFIKQNYLNRFRAPLFIINSLANLLWNLQHPVDPTTGSPLALLERINLCIKAELFINQILDNYEESIFYKIDNYDGSLKYYLLQVERLIKSLHSAFQYQSLNEINLEDVSFCMHRASRIMANKILELIYQKPDASETLIGQIMYLGEMIIQTPSLITKAFPKAKDPHLLGLNPVPSTLTDMLILFSHIKSKHRKQLYSRLRSEQKDVYLELARVLEHIDIQFLSPFEILLLKHQSKTKAYTTEKQSWIARHFLALLSLIMECFTVFQDTRVKDNEILQHCLSDYQQRDFIIRMAASGNQDKYYRWSLSLFLQNPKGISIKGIDELLGELNQMRLMTELLDKLGSIVLENRILLQQKNFQKTIVGALKKIRESFRTIENRLNRVEDEMNRDEMIQRSEKRILKPMFDDVEATIDSIQKSITQVNYVINNPGFNQQQQLEIQSKIHIIQQQFETIFQQQLRLPIDLPKLEHEDSSPFIDESPRTPLLINLTPKKSTNIALISLIQKCYDGLSTWSKEHPKGQSLTNLQLKIQQQPELKTEEIKRYFLEIVKITASPRSSYFFQANYGETRSAKILIASIMDPVFNRDLPIAALLFNNSTIDLKTLNESRIQHRIQELQQEHQWMKLAPTTSLRY